jgi:hypothetical protein
VVSTELATAVSVTHGSHPVMFVVANLLMAVCSQPSSAVPVGNFPLVRPM